MRTHSTNERQRDGVLDYAAPTTTAAVAAMPAESVVAPTRAVASRPTRWLRLELAGQSYAIELHKVQEVQRVPDIVPVRGAAADLLGVINLRGHIVPVIDLAHRLGFAACDPSLASARIVVLEERGAIMGLLVCAVTDVARLDESCIEHAAAALPAFPHNALIGIARHADKLTGLLDGTAFLT